MTSLSLRIGATDRPPAADEDEGRRWVELVRDGIGRGARGALAVALRPERAEWFDLNPVVRAGIPPAAFLAALTRSTSGEHPPPLAVGLAGRFELRRSGRAAPVAMVFLEWADDRWWHWQRLLRDLQPEEEEGDLDVIRRATDGDPVPDGLGRWFMRGRRSNATLRFGPLRRVVDGSQLVH